MGKLIQGDCYLYLNDIQSGTVDLILVDPPYNISKSSNFKKNSDNKKYNNISIDFGDWDKEEIDLDNLLSQFYRILKKDGYLVIFYDVWKSQSLKQIAEKNKFKQPRVCQWIKTNPVPINSKRNYLSNSIEFFFTFVKGKNPIFNSEYDKGIYQYPICHGKERTKHPTQKPLELIKSLINKHSKQGDLVLDCFAGSGTTGVACIDTMRDYILIEQDLEYFDLIKQRINQSL